jgi:hypothetical protein
MKRAFRPALPKLDMPGLAARDVCILTLCMGGTNKNGNVLFPLAGDLERMRHCWELPPDQIIDKQCHICLSKSGIHEASN